MQELPDCVLCYDDSDGYGHSCHFCDTIVDPDEYLCYGCMHYVCEACDKLMPMGEHVVDDHVFGF